MGAYQPPISVEKEIFKHYSFMNIQTKILSKQELVTCEVVIDGYLHTVSYQADTTNTIAKVLQFTDHVALITQGESPSYVLDPHRQATYTHNTEHFSGGQWETLPDDGGQTAYKGVLAIFNMIEQGKMGR